ncbi:MAG: DNA-binding protein [Acidimicrobiales bacterium]|nr:DNA-binding protein [Acidimicrobiales bacterium]
MPSSLSVATHRKHLNALRAETEDRISRLTVEYDELEGSGTDVGAGDDEGGSESDGTFVERDRVRSQIAEDRDLLEQIDAALVRAKGRDWATCTICEKPIGEARLEALPTTAVCVSCKARGTGW